MWGFFRNLVRLFLYFIFMLKITILFIPLMSTCSHSPYALQAAIQIEVCFQPKTSHHNQNKNRERGREKNRWIWQRSMCPLAYGFDADACFYQNFLSLREKNFVLVLIRLHRLRMLTCTSFFPLFDSGNRCMRNVLRFSKKSFIW